MQYINACSGKRGLTDVEFDVATVPEPDGISVTIVPLGETPTVLVRGNETSFANHIAGLLAEIAEKDATEKAGRPTSPMIMPPDSWLVIVARLMAEAIIQGLTWDVARAILDKAKSSLQSLGVAPKTPTDRESYRGLQFRWAAYWEPSQLQKLFLAMELSYYSNNKRQQATMEQQSSTSRRAAKAATKKKAEKKKAEKKKAEKKTKPKGTGKGRGKDKK